MSVFRFGSKELQQTTKDLANLAKCNKTNWISNLNLDCKTVHIFAYSSTCKQSNKRSGKRLKMESETGERSYSFSPRLALGNVWLMSFSSVRLLRHALLILRKKQQFTVLQSNLKWNAHLKMKKRNKTYIFSRRARHINPCLGEEGTRAKHKEDVQDSVYGVLYNVTHCLWRRHVITQSTNGVWPSRATTSFLKTDSKN